MKRHFHFSKLYETVDSYKDSQFPIALVFYDKTGLVFSNMTEFENWWHDSNRTKLMSGYTVSFSTIKDEQE